MAKKTYRFEVRKIVSEIYEVEASNQRDAFEELEGILDQEDLLCDCDDDTSEFLVGADAKIVGSNKPWRHVNGKRVSELTEAK